MTTVLHALHELCAMVGAVTLVAGFCLGCMFVADEFEHRRNAAKVNRARGVR